MKVPYSWLREYVDLTVEPAKLGEDLTLVGLALDGLETDGGDAVLDLDVTTNRVDCMNVYGVAREAALIYGLPLKPLALAFTEQGRPGAEAFDVAIEAGDLCPRFCARVLDVRLAPSPAWIRDRLQQVGVRPISNVVDLTNYVMMEMGHPSHAFDLARVPEGRLHVRWAREGEKLTTLDGVERTLGPQVGVVAASAGALALAGIMGGATSEVSDETRVVALEAAYWEPRAIRRAAKGLGLHTEASHRFERGADVEGAPLATARIAHLLEKIGAGTARPGLIDRVAAEVPRRQVSLRPARVRVVLGTEVPRERIRGILDALGFVARGEDESAVTVDVPTWRGDVTREIDLVEEIARHFGVHRSPVELPPATRRGGLGRGVRLEREIRAALVALGATEVVGYSFVKSTPAGEAGSVALANPLSDEQAVLRTELVRPGLLQVLEANRRQGRTDLAVFEVGRVFAPAQPLPIERPNLAVLLTGAVRPRHWSEKPRAADFFDLKGLLEALYARLAWGRLELDPAGPRPELLHPGQSAAIQFGGGPIGYLGALRPGVVESEADVLVAELGFESFLAARMTDDAFGGGGGLDRHQALPRFPAVERDLSILVPAALAADRLAALVRSAAGRQLRALSFVDRYDRPPVPEGKVSVTLGLRYQDPERTLTGDEVQASIDAVVRALGAAGFEIRGE